MNTAKILACLTLASLALTGILSVLSSIDAVMLPPQYAGYLGIATAVFGTLNLLVVKFGDAADDGKFNNSFHPGEDDDKGGGNGPLVIIGALALLTCVPACTLAQQQQFAADAKGVGLAAARAALVVADVEFNAAVDAAAQAQGTGDWRAMLASQAVLAASRAALDAAKEAVREAEAAEAARIKAMKEAEAARLKALTDAKEPRDVTPAAAP